MLEVAYFTVPLPLKPILSEKYDFKEKKGHWAKNSISI